MKSLKDMTEEDFDEALEIDDDYEDCSWCSGSGEGMWDGSTCRHCHGSGVEPVEKEVDDCYDIDE